jgi:hypothetical protein
MDGIVHGFMAQDNTGSRYGSIVILGRDAEKTGCWRYRCDCGALGRVWSGQLGKLKRCKQCYLKVIGNSRKTHGKHGSRAYRIWQNMKKRCLVKTDPCYASYGGRGISVCSKWMSFEGFYGDMGEPPSDKHQLDRVDNNGNYEASNTRWTLPSQNCRNRRSNRLIEWKGETKTVVEWSEVLGIDHGVLRQRLYRGWDIERAFTYIPKSRFSCES